MAADTDDFQARLQRLDALLKEAERQGDPAARRRTREIVQAVLELHGTGLDRILHHMAESGDLGRLLRDACIRDEVVRGLLLLHGLHPLNMEERVQRALEKVRPYLHSHGGNVELVTLSDGVVRLRLDGSCDGCPSSAATMQQTIEEAIFAEAPDVCGVELEGMTSGEAAADDRPLFALPVV